MIEKNSQKYESPPPPKKKRLHLFTIDCLNRSFLPTLEVGNHRNVNKIGVFKQFVRVYFMLLMFISYFEIISLRASVAFFAIRVVHN